MALRFRPGTAQSNAKGILLSVNTDGSIRHWHASTGKCVHVLEDDIEHYALDYTADGSAFAVGGKDCDLRLYDEATKSLVTAFGGDRSSGAGLSKCKRAFRCTVSSCIVV